MYEPDSHEEMMAAAYAGNGCLSCGASTHTDDNCSWEKAMQDGDLLETDRYLASLARHGGNVYRDHFRRLGPDLSDEHVTYWAEKLAQGEVRRRWDTMVDIKHQTGLPEAAFDWPIYRSAIDGMVSDRVQAAMEWM